MLILGCVKERAEHDREELPPDWSCFVSILAVVLPAVSRTWRAGEGEDDTFLAARGLWSWSVEAVQAISIRRVVLCKVSRRRPGSAFGDDVVSVEHVVVVLLTFGLASTSLVMGFPCCMSHSDR